MKFYITSAIPYVNAKPHIGHAQEFIQADVIARFHRLAGDDVCYLTGSDENALKNVQAAQNSGVDIQTFVDTNAKLFQTLLEKLAISVDVFQKGSDREKHFLSSQKLWNLCRDHGDIYRKEYSGLYCVGCEVFYEKEELNKNGECFEHPGKQLEMVTETNYFFRLSHYQKQLINLINSDTVHIVPEFRKNETLSFLKQGLKDISISRTSKRAKDWGVPVPEDNSQRMYVWFDALNIYQSGIGFGWDEKAYEKWWPADVHIIGKGIIRFHAVYWLAFLLSARLAIPKQLFVHGYITVNGQKMSKTIGNVTDPVMLIDLYGVDPVRYYLLREIPSYQDGDYSEHRFKELYNADLANGLGNLVSRVAKLAERFGEFQITSFRPSWYKEVIEALNEFRFDQALSVIWIKIAALDRFINDEKPWTFDVASSEEKELLAAFLLHASTELVEIAYNLSPFLPETARNIRKQFTGSIKASNSLFPRIQ